MPKQLSSGIRFLLGFISFLLCILLFASTVATIVVGDAVTIVTSKDNLKRIFSQILFSEIPRPQPRSIGSGDAPGVHAVTIKPMAAPSLRLDETAVSDQQTTDALVTWIYDSLSEEYGEEMDLTLEAVRQFVEESTLKDFIAEKGASLIRDYYTGENTTTLTSEEIQEQLELNRELINETFDYEINAEDMQQITTTVVENDYVTKIREDGILNVVKDAVGGNSSGGNAADSTSNLFVDILEASRQIASVNTLLLCIGVCLLLLVLLLVTNIKQIWVGLNKGGITLMVASALFLVPTIIIWSQPTDWMDALGRLRIAGILAREILIMTSGVCISVFSLGFVLLASGITTKCIIRSKYCKQEAQAEQAVPAAVVPTCDNTCVLSETLAAEEPAPEEPTLEDPIPEEPASGESASGDAPEIV